MSKRNAVILAVLRELSKGGEVLIAGDIIGGDAWLITRESPLYNLDNLYGAVFIGEEDPYWFMERSEHYNPKLPCYTLVGEEYTFQVNIEL